MSISKNQIKLIRSLDQKKFRNKHNLFVVEGVKGVREFIKSSYVLKSLFVTEQAMDFFKEVSVEVVSELELSKISFLKSPNKVLALFEIPESNTGVLDNLVVALDGVNDPGNLGTIIRLCDWFGVEQLLCSKDTVDCYNPKVVQSTMGSLPRVSISYVDLASVLEESKLPKYAAVMKGTNVYKETLGSNAVLVMGNEANGIRPEIEQLLSNKLTIPRFGEVKETESLNVATATAILLSEFRRR